MPQKNLTREDVLAGLRRLGELAKTEGIELEMAIYGGALMMLAYSARQGTKGVDAVFRPAVEGKRLAAQVAQEKGWHEDWLNDDVRQFLSPKEARTKFALPELAVPGLRLSRPTARYLLAMKVVASRKPLPGHEGDLDDISFLIRKMNIKSVDHVQLIVDDFFPDTVLNDSIRISLAKEIAKNHGALPPQDRPRPGPADRIP